MSTTHPTIPDRYLIPKQLKLTTHYSEEQHNLVKILYEKGMGIREISRTIPMSRRMVQFIIFPERALLAKQNFARRQKEGRYRYPTPLQSKMVRECRHRKQAILPTLIKKPI